MKQLKAFWLTPKQYPNGSHFNRLEILMSMVMSLLGIAACLGLLWALKGPMGYIAGWFKSLTV